MYFGRKWPFTYRYMYSRIAASQIQMHQQGQSQNVGIVLCIGREAMVLCIGRKNKIYLHYLTVYRYRRYMYRILDI